MTKKIGKLPQVKHLRKQLFLSKEGKQKIRVARQRLADIFTGKSERKILIIGPCSIDFAPSVKEYAAFLSELQKKYEDKMEIIMRFYTGKPRSTIGWKGVLYSEPGKDPDLKKGIQYARKLAIELIEDFDLVLADELLYPEQSARLWDLYSYMAIGARSTEDQLHREVASGLAFPIGIKNPTSGDIQTMDNGVIATKNPSTYLMERVIYETPGNSLAHGILRGGYDGPNYEVAKAVTSPIIVDCNHANSDKHPEKQIEILKTVMKYNNPQVKGCMVESYIHDGRQDYHEGLQKGCSLTDPCIGKEKTQELIETLYSLL